MRRLLALILSMTMTITGQKVLISKYDKVGAEFSAEHNFYETEEDSVPNFKSLSDKELLKYIEDSVYAELEADFNSEDYIIETVRTSYVSKEYLEEVSYNSQSNVFFGYTLAELDSMFSGTKYVFALDENGNTTVKAFEGYDDTYEKSIKNIVIGSGVILVCVTVSVVTGGLGLTPVSMVFAASATTATKMALTSSIFGAISSGVIEGIANGWDKDAILKAASMGGSEAFKWAAISGAIFGGVNEYKKIDHTTKILENQIEHPPGSVKIESDMSPDKISEMKVLNETGGYEQLTFKDGEIVNYGTTGGTRPDVVVDLVDHLEAIEVKNYDLINNLDKLCNTLIKQIGNRKTHLPKGTTQKIILDVTGRGYTSEICLNATEKITKALMDIYPNIPIEIMGLV